VHLSGLGDSCVYTTGYGDLYRGGPHENYTAQFNGTSAATPLVASAAVAVQSFAKRKLGITITPLEMRELLIATGTPQGTGGHIGPLPNIKAACEKLEESNEVLEYSLTVVNGSGSGDYEVDEAVEIRAKDSLGYYFDKWTGDISLLADASSKSTTALMGTANASVTATYYESVGAPIMKITLSGEVSEADVSTLSKIVFSETGMIAGSTYARADIVKIEFVRNDGSVSIGETNPQITNNSVQNSSIGFVPRGNQISLSLPSSMSVSASLYAMNGRRVAELYNGNALEGVLTIPLTNNHLATGVYSLVVKANSTLFVHKMIIK